MVHGPRGIYSSDSSTALGCTQRSGGHASEPVNQYSSGWQKCENRCENATNFQRRRRCCSSQQGLSLDSGEHHTETTFTSLPMWSPDKELDTTRSTFVLQAWFGGNGPTRITITLHPLQKIAFGYAAPSIWTDTGRDISFFGYDHLEEHICL